MQGFVGEEEDLEGDAVFYGEPVELLQGGGDVLPAFSAGEDPVAVEYIYICSPG